MSASPLASPKATREVLERHGIEPNKSLGQNFLIDDNVVSRILELAEVGPDDVIVEVGPGIGTLTCALLANSQGVVAIERDPSLPPVLKDTLGAAWDDLNLVEMDALDVRSADLAFGRIAEATFMPKRIEPELAVARRMGTTRNVSERLFPNKLVSNLPYSVAATIVLDYFQRFPSIDSMTVMVQKEVGLRMQARPGSKDYGAYTVKLSLYAEPHGCFDVSRNCFIPAPHVDSMVVRLDRRKGGGEAQEGSTDVRLIEAACMMADAAFASRRKTISNSMRTYFASRQDLDKAIVPEVIESADVDPGIRGERLGPEDYIRLGRAFLDITGE